MSSSIIATFPGSPTIIIGKTEEGMDSVSGSGCQMDGQYYGGYNILHYSIVIP